MTPQLRFPEFTDEWQMKKLGDIFEFKRTNSLSRAQLSEDGKVGNIHYGDIHKSLPTLLDASKVKLPMIVSSKQFNTADAIKVGDVILADAFEDYADIGKVIEVVNLNHGQELYSGLHTFLMRPAYPSAHGFNGMLFKTATIRKQLMRIATGISVLGVSKNNVSQLVVATPSKPEQEKIADFLTAVDEWIGVGEEKLELLETYKRGVMQKIFTQQVRFKDENGNPYPDWDEHRAGELFKNVSNRQHNGDLPVLSVTQNEGVVRRDSLERKIDQSDAGINSYKVIEPDDFVISLRSFQGGIEKSDVLGISSPAYTVLRGTRQIVPEFFKHYFKREEFISRLNSTVIGIRDGKQISYEPFSTLRLPVPSTEEQQKIATFLTALNDKIKAEQIRLNSAKQWKKGLLQRMFV